MILIVSNSRDVTADFLQNRLGEVGEDCIRLDTEHLAGIPFSFTAEMDASITTRFMLAGLPIRFEEVRSIYYRRPVPPHLPADLPRGVGEWVGNEIRRAWGGALMSRPDVRWMNHPLAISGASYKPEQLARAVRWGLKIPPTLVTTEPSVARVFCNTHGWRVVAKPVGHGEILGRTENEDRLIYTNRVARSEADGFESVSAGPTLFQREIEKDVDVRATVVGSVVVAVALHSQDRAASEVDCRRDNMDGMRYSAIELPAALSETLIEYVRSYNLLYAAIDLIRDRSGNYWFLEINPAGQWAWLEQLAGAPISEAIIQCLSNRS